MMIPSRVILTACLAVALPFAGCVNADGYSGNGTLREITMWVEQMEWEIHPGVETTVWAFCAEGNGVEPVHDGACGVPGPTIRVQAGDTIRLHFRNDHTISHTVHFHGWHPFASDMNGNAALGDSMVARPGETETIEWVAQPAGSFIYHCHFDTPTHMEMGMYGVFIVEDPKESLAPDVDVPMVIDEWQIRDDPADITYHGNMPAYNFFTINGKSFPLTAPIIADKGDHVRLHMVNAGYEFHAIHIHGYTPKAWEGVAGASAGIRTDVRTIAPGQTVVFDFEADREGAWLLHDHVVPRVTAASDGNGFGAYPRGMLTLLLVGQDYVDAYESIAAELLDAAAEDTAGGKGHADEDTTAPADPPSGTNNDAIGTDIQGFAFQDEELHVKAGTTVTWTNRDGAYHTVTSSDGLFDSGNIQGGDDWSYTFVEPGTFEYYCIPHAYQDENGDWQGMVATVVVE